MAGLERARTISDQSANELFYLDYLQALNDITTMKEGINGYLAPSRAQPNTSEVVTGKYRAEAASWRLAASNRPHKMLVWVALRPFW